MQNFRRFEAGPDPFGRVWQVEFRWLQTGISSRHADTVDVKFVLWTTDEPKQEKVLALPHPDLLALLGPLAELRFREAEITDALALRRRSLKIAVDAFGSGSAPAAEAMVALVLAEAAIEKFGGDSAEEMRRNAESYLKALVIS